MGADSWCSYNKVQHLKHPHRHKHNMPESVMVAIKKIHRDLANPELLKKCLHRHTQNPNDSFNNVVLSKIPKPTFVRHIALKLCVNDAISVMGTIRRQLRSKQIGPCQHRLPVAAYVRRSVVYDFTDWYLLTFLHEREIQRYFDVRLTFQKGDGGEGVKMFSLNVVFYIKGTKDNSIIMDESEWTCFVKLLPIINKYVLSLFYEQQTLYQSFGDFRSVNTGALHLLLLNYIRQE